MSDDAEVSEEVIRQMGHEIVRLREQLDASRSPHPRDEESERLAALIAQEKKRADDAVCDRDSIGRRLAASERALQQALAYAPLSSFPASKSASSHSTPLQARTQTISGSASGEDWIYDDYGLLEQLREVTKERDAAFLELSQLKQSMRHLEFGLGGLVGGVSESNDGDETHEGSQLQIVRSISQELNISKAGKGSGIVNDSIIPTPKHIRGTKTHFDVSPVPILPDPKEARVLRSVLNTNSNMSAASMLTSNKLNAMTEMQGKLTRVPVLPHIPSGIQNTLIPPIPIVITENTVPSNTSDASPLTTPPRIHASLPTSHLLNLTATRSHAQELPDETRQCSPRPQTPEALRQSTLALFPVPAGYPPTALQPISLPATLNLHAFLDQATGSAKQSLIGHHQYLSHQVTWCTKRPYHCYILMPRYIYKSSPSVSSSSSWLSRSTSSGSVASVCSDSQSSWCSPSQRSVSNDMSINPGPLDALQLLDQGERHGRWIETDGTAGMRARSAEIFYHQHEEWFYVGIFKAHRLPELTPGEFAQLDERTKQELIRDTFGAMHGNVGGVGLGSRAEDEYIDGRSLYNSGVLKVACVGLQCIGFNDALNRIMHAQSRLLVRGRTLRASSASSYLGARDKRNVSDIRVCVTPPV